ncbi:MAG: hypothetical protein B0D92_04875 [Spirochaeta sp. LUC14_002_19_P3]|nr:MAG: hypothetical protein B0D92_04875 [Spirochaeta sp. LUC14_002_19_P3]
MQARHIILRPLSGKEDGTGHIRRAYRLAEELNTVRGLRCTLIVDNPDYWASIIPGFPGRVQTAGSQSPPQTDRDSTLVLFDNKHTDTREFLRFADYGMPILLDDDGPARNYAPYAADSLPGPRRSPANLASIGLLELPPSAREAEAQGRILVCFGGGNSSGSLEAQTLRFLINSMGMAPERLAATVSTAREFSGVEIIHAPDNLRDELHRFGLVLCRYGLTAFEALAAGCAVITINPSPYHERLSRHVSLPSPGWVPPGGNLSPKQRRTLKALLDNPERLISAREGVVQKLQIGVKPLKMAELICNLPVRRLGCTACGAPMPRVIARFEQRSFYRCPNCGIMGLYRFDTRSDDYGREYFHKEYRKQYGRTYLEDFEAIKAMAKGRLRIIRKHKKKGRLLDIGCAYGPFLQAANEFGFQVYGADVSEAAAAHVRDELGYPAICGAFPQTNPADEFDTSFDVVTLWYVIEHFASLKSVLRQLPSIMEPGALLAMSTPNAAGISARRSLKKFLAASPRDHYTLWTPRGAVKLLARYGFRTVRIRVTGHHPERILKGARQKTLCYQILMLVSRVFRLGDTFEIYARRSKNNG